MSLAWLKLRLRALLPDAQTLAGNRWLRWLGPALQHPRLWHMSRRGIALGAAIGVFFAFLIPVAQIPFSAAVAVALRANLPTAVASTLITNPVTFGPVYYAAWRVGSALLGEPDAPPPDLAAAPAPDVAASGSWLARTWAGLRGVGKPLLLGLVLFACGFGLAVYVLVHAIWRLQVRLKRRRRTARARS
jgi:uncharacterized protein (DUF2062 family)